MWCLYEHTTDGKIIWVRKDTRAEVLSWLFEYYSQYFYREYTTLEISQCLD